MAILMASRTTGGVTEQELERLFQEHYQMLYRTAYSVLDSSADAEDVAQTIFVQFLRNGAPRDLLKNPRAYLYRAAVNSSLNILRSRKRQASRSGELEISLRAPGGNSEEATHQRLAEAIAELQPDAAEMLLLRYVHDFSDADIAKLLGRSRGTIATKLFRTRLRLKKLMRALGEQR